MDLDFLVHGDDMDKLDEALIALGYRRVFHSENVSQYRHPDTTWGSVDFIHAFRKISLAMLDRATDHSAFGGRQSLRIASVEAVIRLKVQAMCNDPSRQRQVRTDLRRTYGRAMGGTGLATHGRILRCLRSSANHAKRKLSA